MLNSNQATENMVKQQLRATGVLNDRVLQAIKNTQRENFVPEAFKELAYADCVIDLGHEQIMLQPKEQAKIAQCLSIQPTDSILEIGTGYGYLTALLAQLGKSVDSYDIFIEFTEQAATHLKQQKIDNVQLITDDANNTWDQHGPYDVICCTAGLPLYPEDYKQGLTVGGRLFAIIGAAPSMQAMLITRDDEQTWSETVLFETVVPVMKNASKPKSFNF
jgi:protein-L-isoaspartate(D-aspartate) O-methyltransferase